ncbi:cyclic nucleotide-binding domain-containing protein [Archangium violaceum]|uniref:cyclic nucleotide-binding domain-containing protein n=1 Tax=Archangium violaceum TaxID=83451 RepID=UPI000695E76F|nr:cyclic nucleotide-binding domain-containing protein [Archangium violaceum]
MSRITSTEVILPSSLSAEARHQLTDTLYAVHAQLFDSEVERETWASCDRPEALYFLETATGHAEGHGLLTVAPLTLETVLSMARALLKRRLRQSMERLAARALGTRLGALLGRSLVVHALRHVPLFAQLDEATLRGLAGRAELLVLPAGREVFQAGSASDELYLLETGRVHVLAEGGKLMDELGSGAVFGELALLTRERRTATVRTATASTLIRIPRSSLLPLLEGNEHLRERMWKTLAERRFDDVVRGLEGYGHLGRTRRLSLLRSGEHRELKPQEWQKIEAGTHLFVLSGAVDFEHAGLVVTQRDSTLLEVGQPLRVRAREATRLVLLNPRAEDASSPRLAV